MRLGLLTDFTFEQRPGGASRASDLWIANFPADPDIELVICPHGDVDRTCDGYLLLLSKLYTDEELGFIATKPFVRYELDYWYAAEPQAQWRDPLNKAARLVIFPSPLHRQVYAYKHRCEDVLADKTVILPPPMNPDEYTECRERWNEQGRQDAIWFGEYHWFKGPDIAMNWAARHHTMIDMYSPTMPAGQRPPNRYVRLCGFAPEERWYDIVASHQYFVHIPREPQCFPYSMLEAYLLGCEVHIGGRTGVESFSELGYSIDGVVDLADQSRTDLWNIAIGALS